MTKITITTSLDTYDVLIGNNILESLPQELEKRNVRKNVFAVVDDNVYKFHCDQIEQQISEYANKFHCYRLPPGEKSKSFQQINKLYSELINNGFGRDTLLIAIGGGVTGDAAGFAASTYMRGIELVHVPTTLLSIVDSAIGGKTGINFADRKNIVGSFYQPKLVFHDTELLGTLPSSEVSCGIGEIIKYAFMADRDFFYLVKDNLEQFYLMPNKVATDILTTSANIKANVVMQDTKESGLRKILNFGHTFGHGIESNLMYKIKHGEAVIAGIIASLYLSHRLGLIDTQMLDEMLELPMAIKLPKAVRKLDLERVYEAMLSDKKNRDGKIKFVLASNIGKILIDMEADKKLVLDAIQKMQKNIQIYTR